MLQALDAEQEVLLVTSQTDLSTMHPSSWLLHYILRPASNGSSMLLRRSVLLFAVCWLCSGFNCTKCDAVRHLLRCSAKVG